LLCIIRYHLVVDDYFPFNGIVNAAGWLFVICLLLISIR
jgi:hypothetical protein